LQSNGQKKLEQRTVRMFVNTEELGGWRTPDPLWFEIEAAFFRAFQSGETLEVADDEEVFFVPWPETKEEQHRAELFQGEPPMLELPQREQLMAELFQEKQHKRVLLQGEPVVKQFKVELLQGEQLFMGVLLEEQSCSKEEQTVERLPLGEQDVLLPLDVVPLNGEVPQKEVENGEGACPLLNLDHPPSQQQHQVEEEEQPELKLLQERQREIGLL
jgi:hypothetical protein